MLQCSYNIDHVYGQPVSLVSLRGDVCQSFVFHACACEFYKK